MKERKCDLRDNESHIDTVNEEIEDLIRKQKEQFRDDYERAKKPVGGFKLMSKGNVPSISGGDVDDTLDCD